MNATDGNVFSRLMACKLCWQVTGTVFLVILAIEAIILVPSYRNYEKDLIVALERQGHALATSLFLMEHHKPVEETATKGHKHTGGGNHSHAGPKDAKKPAKIVTKPGHDRDHRVSPELLMMAERLTKPGILVGGTIYYDDSHELLRFGETPKMFTSFATASVATAGLRSADGNRYEHVWSGKSVGGSYVFVGRLNSSYIDGMLRAFVLRIIGLVLLIATVVTVATVGILARTVLQPMLEVRQHLALAGEDVENARAYSLNLRTGNEISDVGTSINELFGRIQDAIGSLRTERSNLELEIVERRRAEKEAADARHQLRDAIEALDDGFVIFDADQRMVMCNSRYRELYTPAGESWKPGMTMRELAADVARQCVGMTDETEIAEWIEEHMAAIWEDGKTTERKLLNGTWVRVGHWQLDNGWWVATRSDITEAKRREIELAEKSALLQATLDNIDQGLSVVDDDLNLKLWNRRFIEVLELPPELVEYDVPMMSLLQSCAIKDGYKGPAFDAFCDRMRISLEDRTEQIIERERPNGRTLEYRRNPMPGGGMVTTYTDRTEEKRAAAELQQSEERLRSIATNLPGAVYRRVQSADGTITYPFMSAGAEAIFGHTAEAIAADPNLLPGRLHPDDLPRLKAAIQESADAMHPFDIEVRVNAPGGQKWVKSMSKPWAGENGEIIWDGIVLDISDAKQATIDRDRLELEAQHSRKMEALGTMAGGIAHDFNNVLAIINGFGLILADGVDDEDARNTYVDEILHASGRASDLVGQILAFGRKGDTGGLRATRLDTLVNANFRMIRTALPTTISLKMDTEQGIPEIIANPTQVHQVLLNACVNAGHAIGERNGDVSVKVERLTADEIDPAAMAISATEDLMAPVISGDSGSFGAALWIGGMAKRDAVRMTVTDDGTGIEMATLERIFDPFFTTKAVGQGTGLGLAAVAGIIRSHKGAICVRTCLGQGTSMEFYFPVPTPDELNIVNKIEEAA